MENTCEARRDNALVALKARKKDLIRNKEEIERKIILLRDLEAYIEEKGVDNIDKALEEVLYRALIDPRIIA